VPATVRSTAGSQTGSTTTTSFSPSMPAGFVAGDLLVGVACNGGGDIPATRPSGSTLILNVDDGTVFNMDAVRKVAVGGDVFTWTSATARKWAGLVVAVTAGTYDTSTPVQGAVGAAIGTTAVTLFTSPSSTPTSADALIIAAFGAQAANTWSTSNTNPSMTELGDLTTTATTAASLAIYRSNSAPAVASITRSATSTISTANGCTFLMFVNPAASGRRPRRSRPQFRR
jgi:hypothetical protein